MYVELYLLYEDTEIRELRKTQCIKIFMGIEKNVT